MSAKRYFFALFVVMPLGVLSTIFGLLEALGSVVFDAYVKAENKWREL